MMILRWIYEIRSYLGAYGRYIRFRWLFPLIWAVALAAMVWFYGDELAFGTWHPLGSPKVRLLAVAVIFGAYLVYLASKLVRARRADRSLIDAVTAGGAADPAADVAELRGRLRDALKTLRRTLGRGSIYRLPWYALIGAPGAGKTTALVNSGLNFPLADVTGPHPVQGVAGTRFCDWWFTDEAILIDTAGRYTAQDGEQEADRGGWKGFLKLLRKHRPRQPLNGAVVMIGLDDVVNADPAERLRHGRVIRKRLRELDEAFKLRVPAYIVLTKTDRLAGFSAFFDHLDRTTREQVWGVTLPLPQGGTEGRDLADRFGTAVNALVDRLNTLMLDRMQSEPDAERRAAIFAFPSQVAMLADPLHEMLGEMAAASRFDPPPRIRGIYFASAQQDDQPLDPMTRAAAADFGMELPRLGGAAAPGTKSYFLSRLLREVVFGEAGLVSTDPRRDRRNRIIRWAGTGAVAACVLALCAWWGLDYLREIDRLDATEARLALYSPAADQVPVKNVADRDFPRIARVLDEVRDVSEPYATVQKARFTLPSQGDKVLSGYSGLYGRALNDLLLPRLLLQVEADMRTKPEAAAFVPDAVRLYPMLGSRTAMDPAFARRVLAADMERVLPGETNALLRASLDRHVAALVAGPLTPIALDDGLIADALANERSRQLFAKWDAAGGALCRSALADRYPFARASAQDVTDADFKALFGPGGAFDKFFRQELAAKVDTAAKPWRWTEPGHGTAADLQAFERAAAIRAAFFGGPDGSLSVAFDATPVGVGGGAEGVVLDSDGQEVAYTEGAHGDARPVAMTWPGQIGVTGAELSFQPAGPDDAVVKPGFWALFRVLDTGSVEALDASRSRVTFRSGERTASFALRVDGAANPFDLAALRAFRCPQAL